jgi:hypothetical protein
MHYIKTLFEIGENLVIFWNYQSACRSLLDIKRIAGIFTCIGIYEASH